MKNVLLDLGGVVFNSTGLSNEKIDWKIISQLNHKYGHQLNIGEISAQPFLDEYNQLTSQELILADFLQSIFDTLEFNSQLISFLSERAHIYILSDNYRENIAYISKRYKFATWSKKQFYSYDFELTKYQGTKIFELVLQNLDIKASDLIFIDDSPEKIKFAQQCGIPSIIYKNNQQLFKAFPH